MKSNRETGAFYTNSHMARRDLGGGRRSTFLLETSVRESLTPKGGQVRSSGNFVYNKTISSGNFWISSEAQSAFLYDDDAHMLHLEAS